MGRRSLLILLLVITVLMLPACTGDAGGLSGDVTESDLLFGDEFNAGEAGPWIVEGDEFGSTAIQDGQMVIDVIQPGTLQYSALTEPSFDDFDLTVDAQLREGGREATYGLLFRMASPEQFYRFELTGDGRYMVERRDAGENWQRLVQGWQKSPAIMTGPGALNQLRVKVEGPAMAFYVNDELLEELQDSSYIAGQIALDAGTFGGQRTIVAFDNVAVRQP